MRLSPSLEADMVANGATVRSVNGAAIRPGVQTVSTCEKTIVCSLCGIPAPRRGPGQKYCEACSEMRDHERKRVWAKEHPQSPEASRIKQRRGRSRTIATGRQRSQAIKKSITWVCDQPPHLRWHATFSVPFSYSASKNHIYRSGRGGHVFLRRESKEYKSLVEAAARKAVAKMPVVQAKVWIDILVQKPHHRGDAINVVDLVCDGLKKAVGVDDRWFCIRRLDWQVVKTEPKIFIGIGQVEGSHRQICSACGRCLRLDRFGKKKHSKMGVDRNCKKCRYKSRGANHA